MHGVFKNKKIALHLFKAEGVYLKTFSETCIINFMKTITEIKKIPDKKFQRIFGVKHETFLLMLDKLREQYEISHKYGGRPPKIDILNRLCIFFAYYKSYRTMEDIANEYEISVSTTYDIIRLVKKTLCNCKEFQLMTKDKLEKSGNDTMILDCTECEIQRPKKGALNITEEKRKNIRKKFKY